MYPEHSAAGGSAWPSGTMRAVVLEAPGRVSVSTVPIPEPLPGTALVRVRYTGLCGTDLELLHGATAYQRDGRTSFPHVPGHEWSGTVVATADDAPGLAPGTRVVGQTVVPCGRCAECGRGRRRQCPEMAEIGLYGLAGAAADFVRVPDRALVPLPEAVGDRAGAFVEPAVTVVEAFERARCRPGERVLILGTGTIGLLALQFASRFAGAVDVVGVDPVGLDLALKCGADAVMAPQEALARLTGADHGRYPVVIEASGASDAFRNALALAERGGRVAAVGVPADPVSGLVAGDLVLRGVDVLGIQHGLDQYPRTVGLIADGVLDPEPLIDRVFPADEAAEAFRRLESGRSGRPKLLLDFTDRETSP